MECQTPTSMAFVSFSKCKLGPEAEAAGPLKLEVTTLLSYSNRVEIRSSKYLPLGN